MQAQPNDGLVVTTVLTTDRPLMREMAMRQIRVNTEKLYKMLTDHRFAEGPYSRDQRYVRTLVAEMQECVDILGQTGWRTTRKEERA